MVAVPIMVSTTRRERFTVLPSNASSLALERSGKRNAVISRQRAPSYPRPENPIAWASPPKPPRVTPLEPPSEELADDEWLDEVSPPKKPYPDLREPPPDEPCDDDEQGAVVCVSVGAAIPGGTVEGAAGPQLSCGISA